MDRTGSANWPSPPPSHLVFAILSIYVRPEVVALRSMWGEMAPCRRATCYCPGHEAVIHTSCRCRRGPPSADRRARPGATSPAARRNQNGPVAFPLLALRADINPVSQAGHVYTVAIHRTFQVAARTTRTFRTRRISRRAHRRLHHRPLHLRRPPRRSQALSRRHPTRAAGRRGGTRGSIISAIVKPLYRRRPRPQRRPWRRRWPRRRCASPSASASSASPSAPFNATPGNTDGSGSQVAGDLTLAVVVVGGVTFYIYRRKNDRDDADAS